MTLPFLYAFKHTPILSYFGLLWVILRTNSKKYMIMKKINTNISKKNKSFTLAVFIRNTLILLLISLTSIFLFTIIDSIVFGFIGIVIFMFVSYGISESTEPKYSSILSLILSFIVTAFAIPLALDYKHELDKKEKMAERLLYQENKPRGYDVVEIGSSVFITKDCAAAYSEGWFNEMERYVSNGNETAFKEMLANGKLMKLYSGDKVSVIENGSGWVKVEYKGKEVYVINSMLSSTNLSKGKYINAETEERQDRYGGSQQQKDDLKSIDEYGKNHPEFW